MDVRAPVSNTNLDDGECRLNAVLEVAEYFEVSMDRSREIVSEVGRAVYEWRRTASVLGATRKEIDRMASVFEHEDLGQALEIGRNPVRSTTNHETRFSP